MKEIWHLPVSSSRKKEEGGRTKESAEASTFHGAKAQVPKMIATSWPRKMFCPLLSAVTLRRAGRRTT